MQKILLPVLDNSFKEKVEQVKELILSEVNVKELEYVHDTEGVIKKRLKPDFRLLGARMGKKMKAVSEKIANLSQNEISAFEKNGLLTFSLDNEHIEINLNEVEIFSEDIPGWQVANNGELTVALDVTINDALLLEGNARELINRIQRVRKDLGLEVTDHISIKLEENQEILSTVNKFKTYICGEILADNIVFEHISGGYIEVEVNEITVKMIVNKNFQ
jgi:isoleucyl-tRNA synthetase